MMNTMMKMVNSIRASSSYQHRILREFLREVDANADDLLLHNDVRLAQQRQGVGALWVHQEGSSSFLGRARESEGNTVFRK